MTEKQFISNDIISNSIRNIPEIIDGGNFFAKPSKDKNVILPFTLWSDSSIKISSSKISTFDLMVLDVISSMWQNNIVNFTIEMVARMLWGDEKLKITTEKRLLIEASIEKLRSTFIQIDRSKEIKAYNTKKTKSKLNIKMNDHMLNVTYCEIKIDNNWIVAGYHVNSTPLLYEYASSIGQVISFPATVLKCGISAGNTEEMLAIKRELIRRIEVMKNKKNNMDGYYICYEWTDNNGVKKGFFHNIGIEPENYSNWNKKRAQVTKETTSVLDDMVKEKYIQRYSLRKDGRKVIGIDINL